MTATPRPALTVVGPESLIDAVPSLMGFTPTDSLLVIGLLKGTIRLSARIDWADVADDPDGLRLDLLPTFTREGVTDVALIALAGTLNVDLRPHVAVVRAEGFTVLDALAATDTAWVSAICDDTTCCPPEGRPRTGTPIVAEFVGLGVAPLASRDEWIAQLDSRDPIPSAYLIEAADALFTADPFGLKAGGAAAGAWQMMLDEAARRETEPLHRFPHAEVAALCASLRLTEVRDHFWLTLDGDQALQRSMAPLLAELAQRSQYDRYHCAPMFLLAWCSFRRGHQSLAAEALDRVLAAAPDYGPADLLRQAVRNNVNPLVIPVLTAEAAAGLR